ncbi:16S rRNA (uracil(1498)-N(3))-methyltransferase [Leucobacter weissii]|uniref:Ribosomal RNA small subunit methyltransferase E n=1 Tax=Leucobacter weissii TaxID=1983706 RepID=A0A939S8E0_9MICO|nr:16S rRNA (uracil(1498)-N(3))-methyltransferase [Leucobacter weissii]MBO1901976.1 16S rRNA (uracil(1498)-N(3))-methyltransferase [Leucobacter weissii]
MANLYYREDLPAASFRAGAILEVEGEEARHAVRVSRLRVGESIVVGNGAGALGHGEAVLATRDRFAVRVERVEHAPEPAGPIALVQALAKGDRDERAVEQATEFGIDRIIPWQAERSVSRWGGSGAAEKRAKGLAKWRRIAREASKQSLRARIPEVEAPLSLSELCQRADRARVLVLHPGGGERLSAHAERLASERSGAQPSDAQPSEILIVVGPEGGFSQAELAALSGAGAVVLRLGDTVLRTSSAGPAGIAVINTVLGRW